MRMEVRLHGGLERYTGNATLVVLDVAPGATLLALQDQLGIPRGDVGLFVVDGELRQEADVPDADTQVDLYPLFGGG
ncbi:MAG TPA: hypothetical protein VGA61_13815 [Anaerolineae bacterium]